MVTILASKQQHIKSIAKNYCCRYTSLATNIPLAHITNLVLSDCIGRLVNVVIMVVWFPATTIFLFFSPGGWCHTKGPIQCSFVCYLKLSTTTLQRSDKRVWHFFFFYWYFYSFIYFFSNLHVIIIISLTWICSPLLEDTVKGMLLQ